MYSIGKTGRLSSCAEVEGLRHRHAAEAKVDGGGVEEKRGKVVAVGCEVNVQDLQDHLTKADLNLQVQRRKSLPTCLVMESMSRTYKSCSVRIPAERETCQNQVSSYMWEKPWPIRRSFKSQVFTVISPMSTFSPDCHWELSELVIWLIFEPNVGSYFKLFHTTFI